MEICFSCRRDDVTVKEPAGLNRWDVQCAVCGDYSITRRAAKLSHDISDDERWLVSAWIRDRNINDETPIIGSQFVEEVVDHIHRPDIEQKFDLAAVRISEMSNYPGSWVEVLDWCDYPLYWASNAEELSWLLSELEELGYIELRRKADISDSIDAWRLTREGWFHVQDLKRNAPVSKQVFVAMSFSEEMKSVYKYGIYPSIQEDLKYIPMRIDTKEHINRIDDEIILEIRRSRALVADFTGQRGGVYFEAGFAMGLGIPVIWLCKETEIRDVHFDTRQYNFILWNDSGELRTKLTNRFLALAL